MASDAARAAQNPKKTKPKSRGAGDARGSDVGGGVRPIRVDDPGPGPAADIPEHSKTVARGSFWSLAGGVFFKLVSFFYAILVARAAAQDDVGLFNLTLSIVTIAMVFSDLGLISSLQRFVPYYEGRGEKGKIRSLLRSAYWIVLAGGVLFTAALWLASDTLGSVYQSPRLPDAVRLFSTFIIIGGIFRLHYTYMQGRTDIRSMQAVQNMQNLLKLLLTAVLFYFFGPTVPAMVAGFVLSHVIAIAASAPYMRKDSADLPRASMLPSGELLREVLPLGIMLSVLNTFVIAISSADRILLGYLTEPSAALRTVAIYSYAATLSVVLITLPAAIEAIFLPVISRLVGKDDLSAIRSATDTAQRWTLLLSMPLAIVMMVFSGDIIATLFGAAYRPGALAMSIITFAYLLRCYASGLANVLAAMRLVGLELKVYLLVAAVNVGLNIMLIPRFGMEGSAAATVAGFAVMLAAFGYYSKKAFGFSFKPEIYKITAAGLFAFTAILLLSSFLSGFASSLPSFGGGELAAYSSKVVYLAYLCLLMALSGAIFGASCILLRCLHPEDVSLLDKVLLKARVPPGMAGIVVRAASLGLNRGK